MSCPVCNDEGTIVVEVYREGCDVEFERKACTVSTCEPGKVARAVHAADVA